MTNRNYFTSMIFVAIISISLLSCATTDYRQSYARVSMEAAEDLVQRGYYYAAVNRALDSFAISGEESTRQFIKQNLDKASEQGVQELKTYQVSVEKLDSFRSTANNFSIFQEKLKKYQFISTDKADIPSIQAKYELAVSQLLLQEMKNSSEKGDIEGLAKRIEAYKASKLAVDQNIVDFINKVSLAYADQGKIGDLIKFVNGNQGYIKEETRKDVYAKLYDLATSLEAQNKKRNALDTYMFLNELNNKDQRVSAKIATIRNELLTMLAVLDVEDSTDDFVKISNKEFAENIKAKVDNKEKLVEVILKDEGISKVKSACIDHPSCYDYLKKVKPADIQFQNNVRFIVATKIIALKINRQSPYPVKKTANWTGTSTMDGVRVGLMEYGAYGGGKITHYEYDEYTERVNARIIANILVYDRHLKKVSFEDRLQSEIQDETTWAENPMAVGLRNKVPASVMPPAIQSLVGKRALATDDRLRDTLFTNLTDAIADKINLNVLK